MQIKKLFILLWLTVFSNLIMGDDIEKNIIPVHFETYIGGFMSNTYLVSLEGNEIVYKVFSMAPVEELRIKPSIEQWSIFKKTLDNLNIWQWQKKYINEDIRTGGDVSWFLSIQYEGQKRTLKVIGINAFPDENGQLSIKETLVFNTYLIAMETLLNQHFR